VVAIEVALDFVDADGRSGNAFRLIERDGRYLLPRLVITATDHVWLDEATIASCEQLTGSTTLRAALLAAWSGSGPSGHGTRLESPECWLAASHVTEPSEVRVAWAVTWYETSLYERFVSSSEPFRREGSVTMSFEPAPRAAVREQEQEDARWSRGHVAVDFGTSYCTATLFEQHFLPPLRPLSSLQTRQLRAEITSFLGTGPQAGPDARREFVEFAAEVAVSQLPGAARRSDQELITELQRRLSETDDEDPKLLYAVLLELERRVPVSSAALRPALAAALNEMYGHAWRIPALDRLRLFEVQLDPNELSVVESKATAKVGPPLTVEIGRGVDEDDDGGPQSYVYAGLKQRLGKTDPHPELGPAVSSDDLLREALRDILRRCNAFVEQGPQELGEGRIRNVVITFPTMATPPVRRKLNDMLQEIGIPLVDNTLDEAIAAAMFTVLRDFGSDYDTGLELLRSQSRSVVADQKWKQNLLVIDIGGGTTDIALLGLHLHDETPEDAVTAAPDRHGRYYVLIPEVLGSTGRLQLGGELMTLRVFYWIKARLGDQLLRLSPDMLRRPLSDLQLIARGDPGDSPLLSRTKGKLPTSDHGRVFDVLDSVVPTRSAPGYGRPGQAFWLLWRIADRIKLEFCEPQAPEEIELRPAEVRRMLQVAWSASGTSAPDVRVISDSDLAIKLAKDDFDQLAAPDVDEIMHLAYDLAADRLAGTAGNAEPVDKIILTGQASRAPLVRERLLSVFAARGRDPQAISWKPKSVSVVEGQFAKLATSLGACWTKSVKGLVPSAKGAVGDLIDGRNMFRVNADNLFFNLPCTFRLGTLLGGSKDAREVLHIGAEMFQAYPDRDEAVLRSEPFELVGIVAIYRDAQGMRPRWADFQWELTARQQGLSLDENVWPTAITAVLETTSNLELSLLLSRGRPHYALAGSSIPVLRAVSAASGIAARGQPRFFQRSRSGPAAGNLDSKPEFDPSRIVVNAFRGDGDHRGTVIFPWPGADLRSEGADAAFPETFHVLHGNGTETVVDGAVSVPLPEPPVGGRWTFHYQDDKDGLHHIGELSPPRRTGQLAVRYYASVDRQGDLRVHAGEVPFWNATSLAEVEAKPGSVYAAVMEPTSDDYEAERDPFNGTH